VETRLSTPMMKTETSYDRTDKNPPTVSLTSPQNESVLTGPAKVMGSAYDEEGLLSWKLEYRMDGQKEYTLLQEGWIIIMQLSDRLYKKILKYCKLGDDYIIKKEFNKALQNYYKAKELLPKPLYDWEAATWIFTAIGDAYYLSENYQDALKNFQEARKCCEGFGNPFILMRIGQCYFELANEDKAKEFLLQAYLVGDKKVFKGEDAKYYNSIADIISGKKEKRSIFLDETAHRGSEEEKEINEVVSEKIENLRAASVDAYRAGNYYEAIKLLENAWDIIPEAKYDFPESYTIVSYLLEVAIKIKDKKIMEKWKDTIKIVSSDRMDCGDVEMWLGKVNYELENYKIAKDYFEIANKKSGGRCFKARDRVYEQFFRKKL